MGHAIDFLVVVDGVTVYIYFAIQPPMRLHPWCMSWSPMARFHGTCHGMPHGWSPSMSTMKRCMVRNRPRGMPMGLSDVQTMMRPMEHAIGRATVYPITILHPMALVMTPWHSMISHDVSHGSLAHGELTTWGVLWRFLWCTTWKIPWLKNSWSILWVHPWCIPCGRCAQWCVPWSMPWTINTMERTAVKPVSWCKTMSRAILNTIEQIMEQRKTELFPP